MHCMLGLLNVSKKVYEQHLSPTQRKNNYRRKTVILSRLNNDNELLSSLLLHR